MAKSPKYWIVQGVWFFYTDTVWIVGPLGEAIRKIFEAISKKAPSDYYLDLPTLASQFKVGIPIYAELKKLCAEFGDDLEFVYGP